MADPNDLDGDGIPDDIDPCLDGESIIPEGAETDDDLVDLTVLFPGGEADATPEYLADLAKLAGDS